MKNTGYQVDFKRNTITVSADFREKAGIVGNNEYQEFLQLKKDYPTFSIKYAPKVKATKQTHKGLTVKWMEQYIDNRDDPAPILERFNKVKATFRGHPAYYAKMKQWFIALFPDYLMEMEAEAAMDDLLAGREAADVAKTEPTAIVAQAGTTENQVDPAA